MISGDNMTLQILRHELKALFRDSSIDSPEADSGLLLMHVLKISKTELLLKNFDIPDDVLNIVKELAKRRINGEPIQYLTGTCPFMDLNFRVNASTLIPRQDTEILVETVSEYIKEKHPASIWDIGCGSGCIGISLAYMHKNVTVTEFDISQTALDTAEKNASDYKLCDRISFVKHDILSGMPMLPVPDIIVSNPPYIPSSDIASLQREVKNYEPLSALDGGTDGLLFYRRIIKSAPLKEGGLLAFEIGCDQGKSVPSLMKESGYKNVQLVHDLSGNPRVVTGIR